MVKAKRVGGFTPDLRSTTTGSSAPSRSTTSLGGTARPPKFPLKATGDNMIISLSEFPILFKNLPADSSMKIIDEATGKEVPYKTVSNDKTLRKFKRQNASVMDIIDVNMLNMYTSSTEANISAQLSRPVKFSLETDQGELPTPLVNPVAPGTPLPDLGPPPPKFPLKITGWNYNISLSEFSILFRGQDGGAPLELIDEATGKVVPFTTVSTDKTLRKFKCKITTTQQMNDMNQYNNLMLNMRNDVTAKLSRPVEFSLQSDQGELPTPIVNPVAPGTPLPDLGPPPPKFPLKITGWNYNISLSEIPILFMNYPPNARLELIDEATGENIPRTIISSDKTLRKFKYVVTSPPSIPLPTINDMNQYNNVISAKRNEFNTQLSRNVSFSLNSDQGELPTPIVNPVAPGTPLPGSGPTTTKGGPITTTNGPITTTNGPTTTKGGPTTTTNGPTTTMSGPQCTQAFNKSMMELNTVMTDVLALHKKLIDVRNSFAQYRDPNGLGCMTMKGGKRSRKNRNTSRRSRRA